MADTTKREAVYEIRLEQGQALTQFEQFRKKLSEVQFERTRLNKSIREALKEEREITTAVQRQGQATAEQSQRLQQLRAARDANNRALSDAVIQERYLNAQIREQSNDLAKLTEMGLRFRDKMAEATLQALKQSGALEQLSARNESLVDDLARVNTSLERNERAVLELSAAYDRGEKTEAEYRAESAKLSAQNDELRASSQQLEGELSQVTDRLDKAERQVEELNAAFRAGQISQEEYRRGLSAIDESTRSLGAKFDNFVKGQGAELKSTLSGLALQYVGVGAAIYGVVSVFSDAARTVVQFEQALANVSALGADYEARIGELGDAAKAIGPKFGVGATQALGAVENLAKAGVSAADILGGALEGALALATAGGIEVAEASEIAASTMTQFGLAGRDVVQIADLLAAGANKAQGGVDDLGAALAQSGLVAANFGVPVEEAVGALSAFASAGLIGSDAGTSFKTMLQSLVPRSQEAANTMEALGLEFFDARGNFVGLEGVAGQLKERLKDLSDEQRQATLKTIFGSDAVRAATVLYQQGAEGVAKWTTEVNQTGFASDLATKKQDTLSGALAKAGAAWDNFVLSIESGKGPIGTVIRGAVELFTDLVDVLADLSGNGSVGQALAQAEAESKRFVNAGGTFKKGAEEYGTGVATLVRQVQELRAQQQQNIDGGFFAAAEANEAEIEKLVKLMATRRQEGQDFARGLLEKRTAQQQATALEVETIATLKDKLKGLQDAREAINLADTAALAANAEQIRATQERIAAVSGETKALSDKERQAAATKAEMEALANAEPEALAPIGAQQVATDGDLQPEVTREIEVNNGLAQAIVDRAAIYEADKEAYEALQDAKTAALGGLAGALGGLAKEGSAAAKALFLVEKAAGIADIITKLQRTIAAYTLAGAAQATADPTAPARYAVLATAAKINAAVGIATIAGQTIAGFAEGGTVSGDVAPSWGPSIRRANGDNVLVRAGDGMVTLRTGEKVLNDAQQAELESILGPGVWGAIGLPGYAEQQLAVARMLRNGLSGYAEGGTVSGRGTALVNLAGPVDQLITSLGTPRPDPSTVVDSQLLTALHAYATRPIIVDVRDVTEAQHKAQVVDNATTA